MSRKVTLPQTEQEKALGGISGEQYDVWQQYFEPVESLWLNDIQTGKERDIQEGKNIVNAEVAHTFGPQEQLNRQQAFAGGIAPNSGAFVSMLTDAGRRKALAGTMGTVGVVNDVTTKNLQDKTNAARYGLGLGSSSIGGLTRAASLKNQADNIARMSSDYANQASADTRGMFYNTLGAAIGLAGYGGYSAYQKANAPVVQTRATALGENTMGGMDYSSPNEGSWTINPSRGISH
jgi:hypothetical protein